MEQRLRRVSTRACSGRTLAFVASPVAAGAQLSCPFGTVAVPLVVPPATRVQMGGVVPSRLPDDLGGMNMAGFGLCSSLGNPAVLAATAAAMGVLTPMPCTPVIVTPWLSPVQDVEAGGMMVVKAPASCMCAWGGTVQAQAAPSTVEYR